MTFFKECLSCEGDDSSYFKDPNSEMQAEWMKRNDIIVSIYDGVYLASFLYLSEYKMF
mgnify:CR=1 FL=1